MRLATGSICKLATKFVDPSVTAKNVFNRLVPADDARKRRNGLRRCRQPTSRFAMNCCLKNVSTLSCVALVSNVQNTFLLSFPA